MRTRLLISAALLACPGLAWAGLASPAAAQTNDGSAANAEVEIIVTATKREANVQSVPLSVTALGQDTLQAMGATHIEDYARTVPGLVFGSNGSNGGTFAMRGIATSTLAGNTQSPVAIYYDDLPALNSFIPIVAPDLRLFDINRVEVLRGPQGTLFGSGALGGAIRVITNKPSLAGQQFDTETTLSTTEHGGANTAANAMLNMPLGGALAVRAVGYWEDAAGWVDNPVRGANNVNSERNWGGRVMVRAAPSAGVDLLAEISHDDAKPDDAAYTLYAGDPQTYNGQASQFSRQRLTTYSFTGNFELGFADLTSITAYSEQRQQVQRDFSPIVASLGINAPGPYVAHGPSDAFSQELRLVSRGPGPLRWLVGGFYLHNDRDLDELLNVPGAGAVLAPAGFPSDDLFHGLSHIHTVEQALFGELSYDATTQLTLTAGLRAVWDNIHVRNVGDGIFAGGHIANDRSSNDQALTPKFALQYQLDPDIMFYAQAAKGYRIGQLNLGPALDPVTSTPVPTAYGPDSLWNYEAGLKMQFWDRRLTLNLAAYHIDWKDIQLQDSTPSGFAFINNAGSATSQGVEAELRAHLSDDVQVGAMLALNETRLERVNPGVNAVVGDDLPASPHLIASDYVEYHHPLGANLEMFARLDHQYRGKAYSTLNNATSPVFGDFHVVNASVGIKTGPAEITAFITNLTDSNGTPNVVLLPDGPSTIRLRPRTIGLTVRTQF